MRGCNAHTSRAWRGRGGNWRERSEDLRELPAPECEYHFHVAGNEIPYRRTARHRVLHMFKHAGFVFSWLEPVFVAPEPVWSAPLLIHESVRRFPDRYFTLPPQRQTTQPQSIIYQRSAPHFDGARGCDGEFEPAMCDGFQVSRVGEKREHLFEP
jgi:hypothetical protein